MESPYKGKTGLTRLWNALAYSAAGLREAYRCEEAFRQEVWLCLVLLPAALLIEASHATQALLIASVLLVPIVELLNSAIEATVDRVSLDDHRLAKRAKDMGSAAVLVAIMLTATVWSLVLLGARFT